MTRGSSMKFPRKMYLKIILKVTKNQGFPLSLEDTFFKNPQRGRRGGGVKLTPSAFLGLNCFLKNS